MILSDFQRTHAKCGAKNCFGISMCPIVNNYIFATVKDQYCEWAEEHDDRHMDHSVETVPREKDGRVLFTWNHDLSGYGVLKSIVASFVVTSMEADRIWRCVDHLISENGIEWVWEHIDYIKDIIEFHGFVKKDAASE